MIKKILIGLGTLVILWMIGFLISVRLGKVTVEGESGKFIFAYDKENKEFLINNYKLYSLDERDGPYIVEKNEKLELINVRKNGDQYDLDIQNLKKDSIIQFSCVVNNKEKDTLHLEYHPFLKEVPKSTYSTDSKIVAISDIEGNFNALSSFLVSNKVINKNHEWIFGDGHLVLVGDLMDRGENVLECLWMLYKLELEAFKQGGQVHIILGNHELLNFQGKAGYNDSKHKAFLQAYYGSRNYSASLKTFMNDDFVLGKWLSQKNVVEKINNTLYTHGGLSPEIIEKGLDFDQINQIARENLSPDLYRNPKKDDLANLIMGPLGPIWYRGLIKNVKTLYKKISKKDFERILDYYGADLMVVGHTVMEEIETGYDKQLIKIDVRHGTKKYSSKTEGILFDNGKLYKVDGKGKKKKIKNLTEI